MDTTNFSIVILKMERFITYLLKVYKIGDLFSNLYSIFNSFVIESRFSNIKHRQSLIEVQSCVTASCTREKASHKKKHPFAATSLFVFMLLVALPKIAHLVSVLSSRLIRLLASIFFYFVVTP